MSLAKRSASPTASEGKRARHDDDGLMERKFCFLDLEAQKQRLRDKLAGANEAKEHNSSLDNSSSGDGLGSGPTTSSTQGSLDEYHMKNVAEWEAVQTCYSDAMNLSFSGMISEVDVASSFRAHRKSLEEQGYKFGKYNTDRSLFERLDRLAFKDIPDALLGREVLYQVKGILRQINEGSRPVKNTFSMLVMMSAEYVTPVACLVHLLTHRNATVDDLELVWELTDRLWCFGHPIFQLHSGYLDETCRKIARRLAEVRSTSA